MSENPITVKVEMLIPRPIEEAFEAFINPAITTRFWFTKSSGKFEAGKQIHWTWEMFNIGTTVDVKVIEPNKCIVIEWGAANARNQVEWLFTVRSRQHNIREHQQQRF